MNSATISAVPAVTPATLPSPGSVGAWILAARPKTLTAAASPVLVGMAVAWSEGGFSLAPALAALFGAFCIQIGTNFANDLFDYKKGADTSERLGPVRTAQAGLLSARQLGMGTATAFGLAALSGLYLISCGGWPILAVGILSILAGLAYTGGPFPLGYHGLGEVFVFIFFGPVAVAGTVFVQSEKLSLFALFWSIPVGFLCATILVVNNWRDVQTDERAGKRTIAVRFGKKFTKALYVSLIILPFLLSISAAFYSHRGTLFLPILAFPFAWKLAGIFASSEPGPALNDLLAQTAQLLFFYSVLLSVGIAL